MGALRKQMEADMALRGLAYRTRQAYVESVAKLAKFYGKSPDQITEPESQSYLLHRAYLKFCVGGHIISIKGEMNDRQHQSLQAQAA